MQLVQLFFSFLQVGLFSFGGGMASLPLIQNQVVDTYGWLSITEFTDLVTIAEMTPGPIAINAATFVGIQISGIPGAIIATIGCILPSCMIVSLVAWLYFKYQDLAIIQGVLGGLRPAVVALIATAGYSIFQICIWGTNGFSLNVNSIDFLALGLFIIAFFILRKFKVTPILVMLGCGVIGGGIYLLMDYGMV